MWVSGFTLQLWYRFHHGGLYSLKLWVKSMLPFLGLFITTVRKITNIVFCQGRGVKIWCPATAGVGIKIIALNLQELPTFRVASCLITKLDQRVLEFAMAQVSAGPIVPLTQKSLHGICWPLPRVIPNKLEGTSSIVSTSTWICVLDFQGFCPLDEAQLFGDDVSLCPMFWVSCQATLPHRACFWHPGLRSTCSLCLPHCGWWALTASLYSAIITLVKIFSVVPQKNL